MACHEAAPLGGNIFFITPKTHDLTPVITRTSRHTFTLDDQASDAMITGMTTSANDPYAVAAEQAARNEDKEHQNPAMTEVGTRAEQEAARTRQKKTGSSIIFERPRWLPRMMGTLGAIGLRPLVI